MGLVGSKQQAEPYDDYPKGNEKSKGEVGNLAGQNVKVYNSDSEVEQPVLNLNERIKNLTKSLAEDQQELSQVEAFFNHELRGINASTANDEIQESLLILKNKINEKFDTKEAHKLAFQVQCTAQGLSPGFNMSKLPKEVQELIFNEIGADTTDLKSLNAVNKARWINEKHISLKSLGFTNVNAAIDYAITHQLTSINLSGFSMGHMSLEKLCQGCSHLQKLSLPLPMESNENDVMALDKLTALQSLTITANGAGLKGEVGKEFVAMLGRKSKLQSLNLDCCEKLPEDDLIDVIKNMDLLELNVNYCSQLSPEKLLGALENKIHLRELSVVGLKFNANDFINMLKNKNSIQHLRIPYCLKRYEADAEKTTQVLQKLTSLQSITLGQDDGFRHILNQFSHLIKLDRY